MEADMALVVITTEFTLLHRNPSNIPLIIFVLKE